MLPFRYVATAFVLLGLIPVFLYFGGPATYLGLSFGCVLLIAATMYIMFSPAEGGHEAHADAR